MEVNLKAQARPGTGKGPARQARMAGMVPAVLYGVGVQPASLLVDAKEMMHALHTEAGANVLITLQIDSERYLTMPREVQRDPIKGKLIHVDFVKIDRDTLVEVDVPIHAVGESRGVKEGGQLDQHLHELKLEARPADVPPAIEVDITDLGIGDSVHVSDLKLPEGITPITDAEEVVLAIIQTIELKTEVEGEETAEEEAGQAPTDEAGKTEAAPEQSA